MVKPFDVILGEDHGFLSFGGKKDLVEVIFLPHFSRHRKGFCALGRLRLVDEPVIKPPQKQRDQSLTHLYPVCIISGTFGLESNTWARIHRYGGVSGYKNLCQNFNSLLVLWERMK